MRGFVLFAAAALCLCVCGRVDAEANLSREQIERAVWTAKARVDAAYSHARKETIDRVRRSAASPAEVLRLEKQPVGLTRMAVRSADYMDVTLDLLKSSLQKRSKRSINATDLLSEEDLNFIAKLTGCSPRRHPPSCATTQNLHTFRTASSVCNNEENPRWGASNTPFVRWLPAEYEDGISTPKGWNANKEVNGHLLPLVREVSNRILRTTETDSDPIYTHLVTIFGQWTDHDLTFTPHSPSISSFSSGIDCEKSCERTEPCFPIEIPKNDPRFSQHPEECLPFFRSAAACGSGYGGHNFGASTVRQQMNSLTAFIDVGQVYGSDDTKARFLRDLSTDEGLLRVNTQFDDNGRAILPFTSMGARMCASRARITNNPDAEEVPCFLAGDERSNENIALTSLHTLLMREHNRLARALAKLNPHWKGERLYQEARKIMGGYFQVITFRDYLLHIVGPEFVERQLSAYPGYDETVDPSISNVFATAAYRFAHLMVQPFMFRLDENYNDHPDYPSPMLHRAFFAPWRVIFEGGLDPILRGLVGRQAKLNTQDHMMPDALRERLFQFSTELALDLGALNMQRGRDHGLPGYNKWRKFCSLSEPQNLDELEKVMGNRNLARNLLELYGTPDNIDVWLGGVAEPFVPGGRVGPLFACLISTQFQRIREGDRLWWENEGVFTESQRTSLKGTSLARIICDNTGITEVPEQPFQYRERGAGYTQCRDIPAFDLSPWQEDSNNPDGGEGTTGQRGPPGPPGPRGPPGPPGPVYKVAFSMRLGNNFPAPNRPIAFREVIYNGQDSYNPNTGIFTCDIAGVYEFHFHCTVYKYNANVDLRLNGKLVVHSYTSKSSGGFTQASGNVFIKLAPGDRVWLTTDHGSNGLTKDSYFSGSLVFIE